MPKYEQTMQLLASDAADAETARAEMLAAMLKRHDEAEVKRGVGFMLAPDGRINWLCEYGEWAPVDYGNPEDVKKIKNLIEIYFTDGLPPFIRAPE